jgi:hypothetical protein
MPEDKSFEEALGDLLTEYAGTDPDEIISALELALMAAREER